VSSPAFQWEVHTEIPCTRHAFLYLQIDRIGVFDGFAYYPDEVQVGHHVTQRGFIGILASVAGRVTATLAGTFQTGTFGES